MSIIIFLIILAVLVLSHELGHFIVAKLAGMRVDEFGFGFPPRIWGKKYGETVYSVNAIPFGGFVKILGEDGLEENIEGADMERSFSRKPRHLQAAVIVAGVAMNLIVAWLLISIAFMFGMPTPVSDTGAAEGVSNFRLLVSGVSASTPASSAGLKVGDEIVSLAYNGDVLANPRSSQVQDFMAAYPGDTVAVQYRRGGETRTAYVIPRLGLVTGRAAIGISMDMVGVMKYSFLGSLAHGAKTTYDLVIATVESLARLVHDIFIGTAALGEVTGPIGIIGLVGDTMGFGFVYLVGLVAIISVNLAVLNIMPFPALDGGRLFFILVESIKRSPINPKITTAINSFGFALLLLLMVVITWHDIARIVAG
jgi:regulator of sigma E protease